MNDFKEWIVVAAQLIKAWGSFKQEERADKNHRALLSFFRSKSGLNKAQKKMVMEFAHDINELRPMLSIEDLMAEAWRQFELINNS